MSDIGLYGFEIPHDFVRPTRDMVIIRIPFPPERIGNIITPQTTRDLLAHNVMAGRVVAMGPLAFTYKAGDGSLKKQDVTGGDWVLIRPFAGTMVQGGQLMVTSGWRYVSSFNDVIGIIPSEKMPEPSTLLWEAHETVTPAAAAQNDFNFDAAVREKVTFKT